MKRKFSLSSLGLVSAFSSVSSLGDDENISITSSTTSTVRQTFMLLDVHTDLVLIPYQRAAVSPQERNSAEAALFIDSPPYSPSPSESERPLLSSRVEAQLRRACAIIVQETNPSQESDGLPDYNETLKRLNEEHEKAQKLAAAARARASKPQPQARRPRVSGSEPSSNPAPYVHVPQNAAASFEATASQRHPRSPSRTQEIASERPDGVDSDFYQSVAKEQLSKLRAAVDTRPKTSAAACIDYTGPSADTSNSTSPSSTTYEGHARPISTGLSSLDAIVIPGDEKSSSPCNVRVSEQILQDGPSASLADASAKAWMAQELSRRRAECGNGRSARPANRSSLQKQPDPERSSSRASTIASVRDGIKDYIRPRASMDGLHSKQPRKDSFRPGSSDGKEIKGVEKNWWRSSGLRRKESWSSFRNSRSAQEDGLGVEDEGPDLNRALPALPGLDQYKEKRAAPKHIAQLMRPSRPAAKRPAGDRSATDSTPVAPEDSYQQFLAQAERKKRQEASRRAVEEQMRRDAITASSDFVGSPLQRHSQPSRRKPDPAPLPAPTVVVVEVPKVPSSTEKKQGLRKRLSRFLGHGSEKGVGDGKKGPGAVAAAN
ncbi:hypothetical protein MMC07_004991 [Pseudocyphellaria aurata]|nr:hypothetical protein [Pseudocyphellaria aurata]